uniref:NADH-ubiquinone oxidoreductase chain 4L n=1 Tax=Curculionoidea sp. 24 KM-2017 TaxID=2219408 RepID=A0A346RKK0_9CUCU|nr:NADH dehydrogenase subunit 4L [Curculionoidea sp. 24 KM-2017]
MMTYVYIFNFMFLSGLLVFSLKCKHFLIMLLSLEYLVVTLYMVFSLNFCLLSYEFFFLMFFLTMSVCEGALGLSILVSLVRAFGNDYIMNFSMLW